MAKCTFCGELIPKGIGKTFITKEGKSYNFCSRKCEKNLLKLNRNPRDFKWTKNYKKGE